MRHALLFTLLAGAVTFAGCSNGTSDSDASLRLPCIGGQAFCIISCDLGCSQTSCAQNEIAENQRIRFKFSDRVDPASVNQSSFAIRTATGVAPNGEFLVSGAEVTFVPLVSTVGGVSVFGFKRNETYILTLAGGASAQQSVRSISGKTLSSEFTCSVVASRGIQDEDQQPPSVELLAPTNLAAAPVRPTIVLRFSELIDTTPLQLPLGDASPIRVLLRPTLAPGECDQNAEAFALTGLPAISTETVGDHEVTVVTFQATLSSGAPLTLPGQSCINVEVTADLRDLAGRSAVPTRFEFFTEDGESTPIDFVETFASTSGVDATVSGGNWGIPSAGARPTMIGGDGRHGSFRPDLGTLVGGAYEWDVDNFSIIDPLTGIPDPIVQGRFYFTDFILDAGVTLRFKGSVPPIITVCGRVDIQGTIEVNGGDLPRTQGIGSAITQQISTFNARGGVSAPAPFVAGQVGTSGGAGGGKGGNGGDECQNTGPQIVSGVSPYDGKAGEDVYAPNHAYSAQGTAGRGGLLVFPSGIWTTTTYTVPSTELILSQFMTHFSRGGSGGGFLTAGDAPSVPTIAGTIPIRDEAYFTPVSPSTVPAAPGIAFPVHPYPATPPSDYSSLKHYLIGGSGGGGGGSHGFGLSDTNTSIDKWMAGHAGTGGGGAVALRAGNSLNIGNSGSLQSKGGKGVFISGHDPLGPVSQANFGVSSPGGGGSGGSFLLQSATGITMNGTIDTSGGTGSRTGLTYLTQIAVQAHGGDGSDGFYRLEVPVGKPFVFQPSGTCVPTFVAADGQGDRNRGTLIDEDSRSSDTSTWRGVAQLFPPTWLSYELDVDFDDDGTIDETFTDSGEPGTRRAIDDGANSPPVTIRFQGAEIDQNGDPVPGSLKPWRDGIGLGAGPGIQQDGVTGFRFQLIFKRDQAPACVVRELRVRARS